MSTSREDDARLLSEVDVLESLLEEEVEGLSMVLPGTSLEEGQFLSLAIPGSGAASNLHPLCFGHSTNGLLFRHQRC